jgi:hypothetical protein
MGTKHKQLFKAAGGALQPTVGPNASGDLCCARRLLPDLPFVGPALHASLEAALTAAATQGGGAAAAPVCSAARAAATTAAAAPAAARECPALPVARGRWQSPPQQQWQQLHQPTRRLATSSATAAPRCAVQRAVPLLESPRRQPLLTLATRCAALPAGTANPLAPNPSLLPTRPGAPHGQAQRKPSGAAAGPRFQSGQLRSEAHRVAMRNACQHWGAPQQCGLAGTAAGALGLWAARQ